jgi:hypothetical protein
VIASFIEAYFAPKKDIPRPRSVEVLTSERFIAIKRRIMALIHEEAVRALR